MVIVQFSDLVSAAQEVPGPCLYAKKPWISQMTLFCMDQHRKAMQRGDLDVRD